MNKVAYEANLRGQRIGIRTFANEDTKPLFSAVRNSPHLPQFLPWAHEKYAIADSQAWVNSRANAWEHKIEFSFVIYALDDQALLGGTGLNEFNLTHHIGNLGYWVKQDACNQGIATEAVQLTASFGFEKLRLRRIEIVTLPKNQPSRKVAKKSGAIFEGTLHNRLQIARRSPRCLYVRFAT